jgi:Ca-activated chloride channel family protein
VAINPDVDLYAALNISVDATADEIKHAYRQLARQVHPDMQTAQGTAQLFRQVQQSYETLSDPIQRAAYDRQRLEAGLSPKSIFQWKMQPSRAALSVGVDEQIVYLLFDISAGQSDQARGRQALNLCLVLDRSTSMQGARLEQTKASAQRMIDSLSSDDALSIVTFSDKAEVVWPSQPLTDPVKTKAKISAIQASGGTEILQGLLAGLAEIEKRRAQYAVHHLILLTDGQTYGDEERCLSAAEEAARHRIGISALGIGEDWNDVLLDAIASRCGGVSQYIASTGEIQHFLRERLQGLSSVYAENVRLIFKPLDGTRLKSAFKLSPYIDRIPLDAETLPLGALQSDAAVSGIIELIVGPHDAGSHRLAQLELIGNIPSRQIDDARLRQEVTFTFDPSANPNLPAPSHILSALAKVTIFQMQEGALKALEKGDVAGATHRLETMATRLLDMGEHQLARAALLEAGRLARSGNLSPAGRKAIKYGTRSLMLASPQAKTSKDE